MRITRLRETYFFEGIIGMIVITMLFILIGIVIGYTWRLKQETPEVKRCVEYQKLKPEIRH